MTTDLHIHTADGRATSFQLGANAGIVIGCLFIPIQYIQMRDEIFDNGAIDPF
jgi:hypothetical protein